MTSINLPGAASMPGGTSLASSSTASGLSSADVADPPTTASITDQAVLEYLRSKGMANAVLELTQKLKEDKTDGVNKGNDETITPLDTTPTPQRLAQLRVQLETEDEVSRTQRSTLSKATGGGFGYDLDAAAPIAQWGVPDVPLEDDEKDPAKQQKRKLGVAEAKSYLDSFCAIQLWVLSLPEESGGAWQPRTVNVVAKAKALLTAAKSKAAPQGSSGDGAAASKEPEVKSGNDEVTKDSKDADLTKKDENKQVTFSSVISELIKPAAPLEKSAAYPIPLSAKPELLSVSFALLVHTYCELLEVGMESTAHVLRDAFKPVYDPLYGEQYKDLYHCTTTEDMVKLNTHNSQHLEALQNLRNILLQIANIQGKQEELSAANYSEPSLQQQRSKKLQEYNQTIALLQQRHTELSQRASTAFEKMYDLPFLRRARAVRWQITLSNTSYGMLCQFLSSTCASVDDTSLLAMSTLLQTKCELHVERRDPLPFTPAVILDDNSTASLSTSSRDKYKYLNKCTPVQWAAPVATAEKEEHVVERPFPKYQLEEEYDDERSARRSKRAVELNRSIIVNGFRRLEALERKREYEVMASSSHDKTSVSTGTGDNQNKYGGNARHLANPLEPSILLSTLCANQIRRKEPQSKLFGSTKSKSRTISIGAATDSRVGSTSTKSGTSTSGNFSEFVWEESGIGITCAKLCQPDGRKIAIGCDDAAIRVWNLLEDLPNGVGVKTQTVAGDAGIVLLGHKNGFPVFDVSWNRDGRSLLSAGGDGSIRLWDTAAQGPYGDVVSSSSIKGSTGKVTGSLPATLTTKKGIISTVAAKEALLKANANLEKAQHNPDMSVPGLRPENRMYTSGAAMAVYRGHAPNTPIWSVAFAPCGYYFASAGSDATARLWVTDRPVSVRLLTGHTSNSVNSVVFHPNCNYVLTGGEDKTVRLWDIQTGRCVRLLNGCPAGIYKVEIDPSGQYAVGADVMGTVHVWDLATGKKITELRAAKSSIPAAPSSASSQLRQNVNMIHSLAFSACGRSLATGGDDRCVRLWDIRKAVKMDPQPVVAVPHKSFGTRRTMIMDLQYSNRNLLLSVGKYISGIPAINAIAD